MLLFPCLYFILVFFGARTFGLRLFYAVFKTLYAQGHPRSASGASTASRHMEGSTADETWAMGNLEFRWEIPAVNGEMGT